MNSNNGNSKDDKKTIMATVYLKSKTGHSLIQAEKVGTDTSNLYMYRPSSATTSKFLPSKETKELAIVELKKLGFTIEAKGVTISISGTIELFEKTFNVTISSEKIIVDDTISKVPRDLTIYKSSKSVMQIEELEEIIDGIVLATPAFPF